MAGFYDFIPAVSVILLALGLAGVMVYERSRPRKAEEQPS